MPDNDEKGKEVVSTEDIADIPGEERAAILLLSLNEDDAAG
ncbi:MAG: flagellar motor switch protein FliG, partial [Vibrio sp.]